LAKDNVIKMPQLSEVDRQFIALEKQQQQIREQAKLIAEKKMTFQLSNRSKGRLEGVNPQLVQVVNEAIKRTKIDFGVTCGMRTVEEQEKLVASGASQTMKSKHLEGRAVDLVAYIGSNITWKLNKYDEIADAMAEAARNQGIAIKWGAAWSVGNIAEWDGSMEDAMNSYVDLRRSQGRRPFIDAPHFEMM
jgi:peptidoglycan L-alanyl-D-glutamate endopeptidase CwlK